MKQVLPIAVVLTLGLAAAALAQTTGPTATLQKGTPVVVVGVVAERPPSFGVGRKPRMHVDVGPGRTAYTLHLRGAQFFDAGGRRVAKSDLHKGQWIRAEGTVMDDPQRIKVAKLQVISNDPESFRRSAYWRPGLEYGYIERVAGSREVFPAGEGASESAALPSSGLFPRGTPLAIVGEISSPPDAASLGPAHKIQIAVGPDATKYTLHFRGAPISGPAGEKYDTKDLKTKMWVRAEGTVMNDPRRIRVDRLQVLGSDWNGYRNSSFFRSDSERGFIVAR